VERNPGTTLPVRQEADAEPSVPGATPPTVVADTAPPS